MRKVRVRAVSAGSCKVGDSIYINVHGRCQLEEVGINLGHRVHAGIWGIPWHMTVFKVIN